ncbi:hypothetical protein PI125_g1387 [Phytophthora idaei]|nr:hypothetical protein PI125_g1387 [Phytophthora idaei]
MMGVGDGNGGKKHRVYFLTSRSAVVLTGVCSGQSCKRLGGYRILAAAGE